MTDFDHRWQAVARAARRAALENRVEAESAALTARILATWRLSSASTVSPWIESLVGLGFRAALASALIFIGISTVAVWQIDWMPWTVSWIPATFSPDITLP